MHCPWATPPEVVEAILGVRRTYTDYGAKKIRWYLEKYRAELVLPSRTTIHNILCRHDLVPKRRRRTRRWHPGRPGTVADVPNRSWSADFKGEFRTRDGRYCYPLTVQDIGFLPTVAGAPTSALMVYPSVHAPLREFGLPERIRTDTVHPSPLTPSAASRLSVWFVQLGIMPDIEPAARTESMSMHLVLKRRTTRPPRSNMRTQQRAFRDFQAEFNHTRPHEALNGAVPADLYTPSPRPFPKTLKPITYPGHFETRLVSSNGGIRWYAKRISVSVGTEQSVPATHDQELNACRRIQE